MYVLTETNIFGGHTFMTDLALWSYEYVLHARSLIVLIKSSSCSARNIVVQLRASDVFIHEQLDCHTPLHVQPDNTYTYYVLQNPILYQTK